MRRDGDGDGEAGCTYYVGGSRQGETHAAAGARLYRVAQVGSGSRRDTEEEIQNRTEPWIRYIKYADRAIDPWTVSLAATQGREAGGLAVVGSNARALTRETETGGEAAERR